MRSHIGRIFILASALTLLSSAPALAQTQGLLEQIPTTWQIQDYLNGSIYIYNTGSPCAQGVLIMPTGTSVDSENRFVAIALSAKATGKTIGVYYYTGSCNVASFYIKGG